MEQLNKNSTAWLIAVLVIAISRHSLVRGEDELPSTTTEISATLTTTLSSSVSTSTIADDDETPESSSGPLESSSSATTTTTTIAPTENKPSSSSKKTCGHEDTERVDDCMSKILFFGNRAWKPAKNLEEINKYCGIIAERIKCVQNYARSCLKPLPRQLISTIIYGFIKTQKRTCKSQDEKKAFLKHLRCLNSEELRDQMHTCIEMGTHKAESIPYNISSEDHIPAACCGYQVVVDCIQTALRKGCKDPSIENEKETIAFFESFFQSVFGDIMDLACGGKYTTVPSCEQNLKHVMLLFKEIESDIRAHPRKPKAKSPFKPFIDVFTKYDYR